MVDPAFDEEIQYLRKRARRRLVGAVALVFFALIILWTSLDNRPPEFSVLDRSIEVISSDLVSSDEPAKGANIPTPRRPPSAQIIIASPPPAPPVNAKPSAGLQPAAIAKPKTEAEIEVENRAQTPLVDVNSVKDPAPVHNENLILRGKLLVHQKKSLSVPSKSTPNRRVLPNSTIDPRRILEGLDDTGTSEVAPSSVLSAPHYFVQIVPLLHPTQAKQWLTRLRSLKMPASAHQIKTARGELIRIRIGPTKDQAKANEWLEGAKKVGITAIQVVSQ